MSRTTKISPEARRSLYSKETEVARRITRRRARHEAQRALRDGDIESAKLSRVRGTEGWLSH